MTKYYVIEIEHEGLFNNTLYTNIFDAIIDIKKYELEQYDNEDVQIKDHSMTLIGKYDTYYITELKLKGGNK